MLVGTAEVVKEPVDKVVFLEDLSAADAAKAGQSTYRTLVEHRSRSRDLSTLVVLLILSWIGIGDVSNAHGLTYCVWWLVSRFAGALLPAGLVNLGNTCYMNSTLQVRLTHTDTFVVTGDPFEPISGLRDWLMRGCRNWLFKSRQGFRLTTPPSPASLPQLSDP
jgi:hypothetical protein